MIGQSDSGLCICGDCWQCSDYDLNWMDCEQPDWDAE